MKLRGETALKTSEKVQWTLAHRGDDAYVLAQIAGVPVRVVTDLLWGRLAIADIRLSDAERLAALCQLTQRK